MSTEKVPERSEEHFQQRRQKVQWSKGKKSLVIFKECKGDQSGWNIVNKQKRENSEEARFRLCSASLATKGVWIIF